MMTLSLGIKFIILVIITYNIVIISPTGLGSISLVKNGLFGWNTTPNACAANSGRLLNLVNSVCSTAQAVNATARDACYGCFARFVAVPQGQQQMAALSICASLYFTNTSYAPCATRLATIVNGNNAIFSSNRCTTGYCEFVQCLRRVNSNNLIIQCSREVIAMGAVNLTLDADAIRYYTNMTSCILAKSRCSLFNPITGDPQYPGTTIVNSGKIRSQVPIYNTLQIASDATIRIIAFPATIVVPTVFCSSQTTLAQTNWPNNECP